MASDWFEDRDEIVEFTTWIVANAAVSSPEELLDVFVNPRKYESLRDEMLSEYGEIEPERVEIPPTGAVPALAFA